MFAGCSLVIQDWILGVQIKDLVLRMKCGAFPKFSSPFCVCKSFGA